MTSLLLAAADLIEQRGFTVTHHAVDSDGRPVQSHAPEAAAYCVSGAIRAAVLPFDDYDGSEAERDYLAAADAFCAAHGVTRIVDWLQPDTTREHAVTALRRAAAEGVPVAVVVVVLRGGDVLTMQRAFPPLGAALPGGKVDPGEEPHVAAARELREETGLVVSPGALVPIYDGRVPSGKLVRAYYAPDPGGDVRSSGEGAVIWGSWDPICEGPYQMYNTQVRAAARGRE